MRRSGVQIPEAAPISLTGSCAHDLIEGQEPEASLSFSLSFAPVRLRSRVFRSGDIYLVHGPAQPRAGGVDLALGHLDGRVAEGILDGGHRNADSGQEGAAGVSGSMKFLGREPCLLQEVLPRLMIPAWVDGSSQSISEDEVQVPPVLASNGPALVAKVVASATAFCLTGPAEAATGSATAGSLTVTITMNDVAFSGPECMRAPLQVTYSGPGSLEIYAFKAGSSRRHRTRAPFDPSSR